MPALVQSLVILLTVSLISSLFLLSFIYHSEDEATDALINAQMMITEAIPAEANMISNDPRSVSRRNISRYDELYPSRIGEYDARDLLHPDDEPWGQTYSSRVWCSVLTMWPERRQNIEVEVAPLRLPLHS